MKYGSLWKLQNQGFESLMGTVRLFVERKTQHGGHCGKEGLFGIGMAMQKKIILDIIYELEILHDDSQIFERYLNAGKDARNAKRKESYALNPVKRKRKRNCQPLGKQLAKILNFLTPMDAFKKASPIINI